jgi:hypothetical protein
MHLPLKYGLKREKRAPPYFVNYVFFVRFPFFFKNRGVVRNFLGDFEGALDDFQVVLTLYPDQVVNCDSSFSAHSFMHCDSSSPVGFFFFFFFLLQVELLVGIGQSFHAMRLFDESAAAFTEVISFRFFSFLFFSFFSFF